MEDGVADVRRPRRATYGARPFDGKDRREGVIPEGKGGRCLGSGGHGDDAQAARVTSASPCIDAAKAPCL
jgi:hypothetical protein